MYSAGHRDVHEHDVGMQHPALLQDVQAVHGLADHRQAALGGKVGPQPFPYDRMVVREQNPDGAHACLLVSSGPKGIRTVTRVPLPGEEAMVRLPPIRSARCFMFRSPRVGSHS